MCSGQGTEAAEPAETLETGEVAPKLRRDEETGYWIVRKVLLLKRLDLCDTIKVLWMMLTL